MNRMIENYINGNLTTAKQQAKRFGEAKIRDFLTDELGWTNSEARAVAAYLKGTGSYQAACEAHKRLTASDAF